MKRIGSWTSSEGGSFEWFYMPQEDPEFVDGPWRDMEYEDYVGISHQIRADELGLTNIIIT